MNSRHKRAMKRTFLVFIACSYPLWFFYKYSRGNVDPERDGFGVVPQFTLTYANQAGGFTHYQTQRTLTVVAIVRDSCPQNCPETVAYLREFKTWADAELRLHATKMSQPKPIRFVIQTTGQLEGLPQDWAIVAMENDDPYLAPTNRQNAAVPAIVLIDDNGFYRAYQPLKEPTTDSILRRELSRMISQQFLYHYVSEQALMWDKTKGPRAGK